MFTVLLVILGEFNMENIVKTNIVILLLMFNFSCGDGERILGNKKMPSDSYPVVSLKGQLLEISDVQTGMVRVSEKNRKKLYDLDENGEVKYYTSELINYFEQNDDIKYEDGYGLAVRFRLPVIKDSDYIILNSDIILPEKVKIGDNTSNIIQAAFRYTSKHSERVEYIWVVFDEANLKLFTKGEWELIIYNQDTVLLNKKFNIK